MFTSCGGTSYVWVLMSIFWYWSTQGITKKTPGPLAPPERSRPSRNMTALSYSWTTLITRQREKGRVAMTRRREQRTRRLAQRP